MKSIWINKGYIAQIASAATGGIYALLGFIGTFVSLDEILPFDMAIWLKVMISVLVLLTIWGCCFCGVAYYMVRKKYFQIFSANNGHALYVQYGDLFDEKEVKNPSERRNIVVPVNCCFDTRVDNHIISEKTVHGKVLKHLYESGRYTEESLTKLIEKSLENVEYKHLSEQEKPEGNRNRYPVGTVIDLPESENTHYFLWALSTFDSNLKAHTSIQEYVLAVQKLIEACNTESEGFPVVLPLVGTGLSRTKKNQQDILQYLINICRLNQSEINCDIHIVVRENVKNEIAIMNIH